MPTLVVRISAARVMIRVAVSDDTNGTWGEFDALVDTGAERTMVSNRLVEHVGAAKCGVIRFMPASGQPQETSVFKLRVGIAALDHPETGGNEPRTFDSGVTALTMLMPIDQPGFDVLLGMNVLSQYHITMHKDLFLLSS